MSGKTCKMSGKNLSFERKIFGKVWKLVQLDSVPTLNRENTLDS